MKKLFLLALSAFPILAYAQVGIGIATPTAKLDINGDLKIRQVTIDLTSDPAKKVLAVDANGLVGYTAVITTGADNWGTQVAVTQGPITGTGVTSSPIGLIPGTAQGQVLVWDAATSQWVLQVLNGADNWGTQVAVTQGPIIGTGVAGSPISLSPGTGPEQIFQWNSVTSQWELHAFPGWLLKGNNGTTPGTGNNYLGTNDNADLAFATVATEKMRLTQGGNLGIATTNPLGRLHIGTPTAASANIFATSASLTPNTTLAPANIPTGAGTRVMWVSERAAWRMGGVSAGNAAYWDAANIGNYSYAAGYDAKASGLFSFCVGNTVEANASGSTALGKGVNTINNGSFQIGDDVPNAMLPAAALTSTLNNQFSTRFNGGYRFFTDYAMNINNGMFLSPASSGARLGVGTDAPSQKLHVVGGARIEALGGAGTQMVVANNTGVLSTQAIPSYTAGTGINMIGNTISTAPHTGDVVGSVSLTVTKIQGVNVSGAFPAGGQILRFNSGTNQWEPFSGYTGTVTVKGSAGSNCTMTYQNGLLISTTCP